jgi:hypothetical protein
MPTPLKNDWTNGDTYTTSAANALATQVNDNTNDIADNTADILGKQASDSDLTAIAALTPTNGDTIMRVAGVWLNQTMAQLKTALGLTKSDVGLSNVTDHAQYYPGGTDIPITDGGTGVSTLPAGLLKGAGTGAITAATAGTDYYAPTGTDVTLADGGTGTSLTPPVTDKFVFYDVSSGAMAFLTPGTGMTITGTTVDVTASGPSASTDSELVLFSGTSGKIVKRSNTITGLAKLTSGVVSAASAGTDYYAPGSTDVPITDGGTGVSTLPSGLLKGAGTSAITAATAGTDYVTPTGTENLTNKTFTVYTDYTSQGSTAPATPSANTVRIFARTGVSTLDSLAYINTLGVPIVLGRDVNFFAKNTSGSTIAKGSVVAINSASGSIPLVIKAQADAGMTKLPAVGVVVADIANNAVGMVMITGTINNVNTSGVGAGNTLYVSPSSAGVFTDTRPAHPQVIQPIGECLNSNASTGAILVNCTEINPGLVDGTNQASFAVGDGTGAGAKSVLFKNSNTGTLQWTPTTSRTITLPDGTGTVYVSGGTDIPITDGGTGVSTLPSGLLKGAGTSAITAAVAETDYVTPTGTGTISGKRITKRSTQVSNTTSWTINTDLYDFAEDTGLTGTVTIGFSGTPTVGQTCWVTVTGTATRTIAYDSTSEDSGNTTRPTTTSGTAPLDIGFRWNSATSKWRCIAYS